MKKPDWLKVRPPLSQKYFDIKDMLKSLNLSTVCQEARCPNIEECWGGGTATFMKQNPSIHDLSAFSG